MLTRRTDLAMEAAELRRTPTQEGICTTRSRCCGYEVTEMRISSQTAAQELGKPPGRYCTIDLRGWRESKDGFQRAVESVGAKLSSLLPADGLVLVVGLGNRRMTPDALGALTVEAVLVTRHLLRSMPRSFAGFRAVAAMTPGVVGETGLETAERLPALLREVGAKAVIAVDALAARSVERLCTTVQLADSGIVPGSGVGNHRRALNQESLGLPVIALGVPTVVDSMTLAMDVLEAAGSLPETLPEPPPSLFVTPRDVDAQIKRLGQLLGWGINRALQPQLSYGDLQALLSEQ